MQSIDELIAANKGLVMKQLNRFQLVNDSEAEGLAYDALYSAIQNYDPSRGTKLSTLATVYIYNALGSYVRSLDFRGRQQTVSYDNYIDQEEKTEFIEMFASSESLEDAYIHKELCRITMETFNTAYEKLTNDKHKRILALWKESDFTATTVQIAQQTGLSQSYVSQVINNFKATLKKKLEDIYYD